MSQPLAAVTGATGFLGQHIVRAFAEAGWNVRILARRDPSSPFWTGLTPQVIAGSLNDDGALARLCDGADVVVHAAGLIGGRAQDLEHVNVEGSRRVAAAVAPAARFLQISSLAAREPHLSSYAASKRAGEDAVRALLGDRAVIVRPPAVYGPGDRETLRLFALAASSPVLPVLDPSARMALIHAQDAAAQVVSIAQEGKMGSITLSDARPEGYGWRELMQTASSALGRRPHLVHMPAAALYAGVIIGGFGARWRKRNSAITLGKVRELTHVDWGVRPSEQAVSAPAPQFDLLSGFLQTIAWYRTQDWL